MKTVQIYKVFWCQPACCFRVQVNRRLPCFAKWSATLRPSLSAITLRLLTWKTVRLLHKSWWWARMIILCQLWGMLCYLWLLLQIFKQISLLGGSGLTLHKNHTWFSTFSLSSLNKPFGSGIVTPSGILLNSQILDFSWPNKTENLTANPVIVNFGLSGFLDFLFT